METAKARIDEIIASVKEDKNALNLIHGVLAKAQNYVDRVFAMETALQTQRPYTEGGELRKLTEDLDGLRSIAHNALISEIQIVNRYLFKTFGPDVIPPGGVYSKDPVHLTSNAYRSSIGDWAGELVVEYFTGRKK